MKTIALFGKTVKEKDVLFFSSLADIFSERADFSYLIWDKFDAQIRSFLPNFPRLPIFSEADTLRAKTDFLFSFGGDGTLLDTLPFVAYTHIPVLGIHLGHLGFLTGVKKENFASALEDLAKGRYVLEKRMLLSLSPALSMPMSALAVNDIVFFKKDTSSLLRLKVEVNGKVLHTCYGDGLIFATPTGSTAYSLSCGGPILMPEAESIVITPIASHTLTVRPCVLPADVEIKVFSAMDTDSFKVSVDSNIYTVAGNTEYTLKKADAYIQTLRFEDSHFFDTIREKLLWGVDFRS